MKEIAGFPDYCISESGDVISFKGKKPKVLRKAPNGGGYLKVCLCKDGKVCYKLIHRLIAEAFIPNPLGLPQVNHKDENPRNNRVENLEWCDCKYNNNYGTRNERAGKALSKPVSAFKNGVWVGDYPSANEAARQLGLNQGNITGCCKGKLKHVRDFVFVYKDGEESK